MLINKIGITFILAITMFMSGCITSPSAPDPKPALKDQAFPGLERVSIFGEKRGVLTIASDSVVNAHIQKVERCVPPGDLKWISSLLTTFEIDGEAYNGRIGQGKAPDLFLVSILRDGKYQYYCLRGKKGRAALKWFDGLYR